MFKDRAAGALVGGLIGDALGLGCHWYYDLEELRRRYGSWISDYTTPAADWYHSGMKPGQSSQTGLITLILLRSVIDNSGYVEADFTARLEAELFTKLDGTAKFGPGGYTNQSIRETFAKIKGGRGWSASAGEVDTTEAAERAIVLSILYSKTPRMAAATVASNCRLTHGNDMVVSLSTAYNCTLAMLLAGEKLDWKLIEKLLDQVVKGDLPFQNRIVPQKVGDYDLNLPGLFPTPDPLMWSSWASGFLHDPGVKIEPASKIALVYGLPCAIYYQLPAAYYLTARFPDDFESAVLHAINGGGQNMSRAFLTGALVGAQVGLSRIPKRFISGLENADEIVQLSQKLADLADTHPA
jgi:ADP-ribosylglycohydrolase